MRFLASARGSIVGSLLAAAWHVLTLTARNWNVLRATTHVELQKRYAGSMFGVFWIFMYPALLLSIYIFVYMVVFKMRLPEFSEFDYVLFVFAGLVPYLGMMEALSTGCGVIKQNMHMVKNVMMPIDLVPVRSVLVSMTSLSATMLVLLYLGAWGGRLTVHVLWLPLVLVLLTMFFLGLVYIVGALGVLTPDVGHIIGLVLLLLMFLSPIGYRPEMVPPSLSPLVTYNPVYYMAEMVRCAVLYGHLPSRHDMVVYVVMCVGTFVLGAAFFRRFKNILVDYE